MSGEDTERPAPPADPSVARTLRWIALCTLAIAVVARLGDVLLLMFAGCLLATVLTRTSGFLGRRLRIGRGAALALLLGSIVALLVGIVWWRGPGVADEGARLMHQLDDRLGQLRGTLESSRWGRELVSKVRSYLGDQDIAGATRGFATATLGLVGSLVLLLALAVYLAATPQLYIRGALRLLPPRWRGRGRVVLHHLGHALFWWFLGQLMDMAVVGILSYVGLSMLGVPLAGTLAGIAGLLNFVPYIGAIGGAVPAVIVAFGSGTSLALETAGLFVAIQTLEGYVIGPLIQRRTIDLPPVLTILSQTVLGSLFGPAGLVLATPIVAALLVLVRMVYVQDVLGDRSTRRG